MKLCQDIPLIGEYDVVVCGGGVAGFCAAIAAARNGANTALIEQEGALGGIMTVGGNSDVGLFYAHKKQIIAGIGWEFVSRLEKLGWAKFPDFENETSHPRLNVMVNPLEASVLMDKMCREAGVSEYLSYTLCAASAENGVVQWISVCSKRGLEAIKAKVFIDCTGDGQLSYLAGSQWEMGDCVQPATYRVYLDGCDAEGMDKNYVQSQYLSAVENNVLGENDFWAENVIDYFKNKGNNANHIDCSATNLTKCEIEGRASASRMIKWANENVLGAEKIKAVSMCGHAAYREWRRIVCDHKITVEEYVNAVDYDDSVCYSYYPIDLHKMQGEQLENIFISDNLIPKIPYSALTVKNFSNLLVAGRCIYSDRQANSAIRVKCSCMATGECVGVAAAVTVNLGEVNVRNVNINELRNLLENGGAIICK